MTDTDNRLELAGAAALAEAQRLWQLDVRDPAPGDNTARAVTCRATIESLIRAVGWTWALPYLGHDRTKDGVLEWCGIFAGACWVKAGLEPALARIWVESTERLDACARYEPFAGHPNPRPAEAPYRMIAELDEHSTGLPWQPRAGDILTIGPTPTEQNRAPAAGKHICLVDHFDADHRTFYTLEGNGLGLGPSGEKIFGVVRGMRPLGGASWHARRLIRFAASDLVA